MALKEDVNEALRVEQTLQNNKVANFSYTDKAYTDNDADGVRVYDYAKENNIPSADFDILNVNQTVLTKGFRSQASSITRMLMNHFLGRMSYNLNKLSDIVNSLLTSIKTNLENYSGFATLGSNGKVPDEQLGRASANGVASLGSNGKVPDEQLGRALANGVASLGSNGKVPDKQLGRALANGVASLDANGRIPYSQLPESAMEFKGTWNAETNTPSLANGTGTKGDFYVVSVAGFRDLGSGEIAFSVNDRLIYNGSEWVKLASGGITSVNRCFPDVETGNVELYAGDIQLSKSDNLSVLEKIQQLKKEYINLIGSKMLGGYWSNSNITSGYYYTPVYANGIWVAGSSSSGIKYSTDGKTWNNSNITSGYYYTPVYTNGIWVAGSGSSGSGSGIKYSTDGKTWNNSNITSGYYDTPVYTNGIWVAGSSSGSGIKYSTDGKTWNDSNITSGYYYTPVYTNGIWVAGSGSSGSGSGIKYSTDGKTWNDSNITSGYYYTPVYTNGIWVAGSGSSGSGSGIKYSTDGKTWNNSNITSGYYYTPVYANGIWVASSSGSGSGIKYSSVDDLIDNGWLIV